MPLSLKNQGPCHYLGGSQWLRAKNLKSGSFSIFVGRQSMSTFCPLHTVTPYLRLSKVAPVSLLMRATTGQIQTPDSRGLLHEHRPN